jgi:two-component sensor histidine kinase
MLGGFAQAVLAAPTDGRQKPEPLLLQANDSRLDLATQVAVLEDCGGALTINDVERDEWQGRFTRPTSRTLNFGYSSCAFWVRLDVVCGPEACDDWLLVVKNPRAEHVDLYRKDAVERLGSSVPMSARPMRVHYPTFPLGHLPDGAHRLTLRLQTSDVASYPVSLIRRSAFVDITQREHLVLGLYFGLMLFTALFSAVVFLYLRDTAYLLFAPFVACYCLFEVTVHGLDIAYLWPEQPLWNLPAIPLWCSLTVVSGAAFAARFLMLREYAPGLRYPVYGVLVSGLVMMGVTASGAFTTAGILGSLLSPAAVVTFGVVAVIAMVRGCPHAKYFLLAGTLQFLGVVLNGLRNFSVLPDLFITTYGGQLGSIFFVVLVSLALMARFDRLRRENEHAQEQALQSQRAAADAKCVTTELRLQALQAKINPHFLFNTLNTIAGLIAEAPERAQGVVVRLSRLFRYILTATTKDRVLLVEELSIVRSYLEVEQERFGERLRFDIQVDGDIEGMTLPGLTIQPLVENSVKHGLRPKIEGGHILVRARVAGSELHLTIADDGVGMDPTLVSEGHGLHSVRERLRLSYGAASSLILTSPPGTRIEIRMPVV